MNFEIKRTLLSRQETAEMLGISVRSLREMERREEIQPIQLGQKTMFSLEYLQDWIKEQQTTDKNNQTKKGQ